ncbi:T9SS type A sorting domain-containing protein [Aquimarina rhabdastrellae]
MKGKKILYGLLFISISVFSQWSGKGNTIVGVNDGDVKGQSLSLSGDGNRIFSGKFQATGGSIRGSVEAYQLNGANWEKIGSTIEGPFVGDFFSVDMNSDEDGDTVVIGNSRGVSIYRFDGSDWNLLGDRFSESADEYGLSVDINDAGDRIIFRSEDLAGTIGSAQVYDLVSGNWVQVGNTLTGVDDFDRLGTAVSISGDGTTIAVGIPGNSDIGTGFGAVKLYTYDGSNWVQKGDTIYGTTDRGLFGEEISLDENGNTVIVGEPELRRVRVFELSGSTWNQKGPNIIGNDNGVRRFAEKVDISADGNNIIFGIGDSDINGVNSGEIGTYEYNNSQWEQRGSSFNDNVRESGFGRSVSMSNDGNIIAVGAPLYNGASGTGFQLGFIKAYEFENTLSITENSINNTFIVYPNPFTDKLRIQSGDTYENIKLLDIHGKTISEFHNTKEIATGNLSPGVYHVAITTNNKTFYKKIIKQ